MTSGLGAEKRENRLGSVSSSRETLRQSCDFSRHLLSRSFLVIKSV